MRWNAEFPHTRTETFDFGNSISDATIHLELDRLKVTPQPPLFEVDE